MWIDHKKNDNDNDIIINYLFVEIFIYLKKRFGSTFILFYVLDVAWLAIFIQCSFE
jgi:hypothetical protein